MRKKIKKAFTLVELLVVIAILAILATVSIVGYNSFTKKAKVSNDTVLVKQMNDVLFANQQTDDKNNTMTEALEDVFGAGYDVEKLTPTTTNYNIVWDSENDQMVLLDDSKNVVYPTEKVTSKDKMFLITKTAKDFSDTKDEFAHYLTSEFTYDGALAITTGLDAGSNTNVSEITYTRVPAESENESNGKNILIRTNGGTLTINAANDSVAHYSNVDKVIITAIAAHSYHEHGEVSVSLEVKDGHVVLESNSLVKEVIVPTDASSNTLMEVKESSTVGTIVVDSSTANVTINDNSKVENVVASNSNTNISIPSSMTTNKVEKKIVSTKNELLSAINDTSIKYIELASNIDVENALTIERNLIIDGTENKYEITAKNEIRDNSRTINVGSMDNHKIDVTLKNIKINGPKKGASTRGLNIWYGNVSISLINSEITCEYYAINITSLAKNANLNIYNSSISGWAALNIWAGYSNINVTNSELIGTNNKTYNADGWNNFSTICFEADTTDKTTDHTYSSKVVLKSSIVKAIETTGNVQNIVSFNYNSTQSSIGNYVEFIDCRLEYNKDHNFKFNDAPNTIIINGNKIA